MGAKFPLTATAGDLAGRQFEFRNPACCVPGRSRAGTHQPTGDEQRLCKHEFSVRPSAAATHIEMAGRGMLSDT